MKKYLLFILFLGCHKIQLKNEVPNSVDEVTNCKNEAFTYNKVERENVFSSRSRKDTDKDGIPDNVDNCVLIPNTDQKDCNKNSIGDVCDNLPCVPVVPLDTLKKFAALLDFDGELLTSSYWVTQPTYLTPANLTFSEQQLVLQNVTADFKNFNLHVTTDTNTFNNYKIGQRIRVIITEYNEWYGLAGGVAYINSIKFNDVPCFVFSKPLNYRVAYISDAASHEIGHSASLSHQIKCVDGIKTSEYNNNSGFSTAPIMGSSYDKIGLWRIGDSKYCSNIQYDSSQMTNFLR